MREPVFIHAWWRSGSTYLWAKLRRIPGVCCYYEPLHERIAKLRTLEVLGGNETSIAAMLRHPPTQGHYFAEYADWLTARTGSFRPELSYRRFFLGSDAKDPDLQRYLEELRDMAQAKELRAVFSFCRSQMRSAWMKRHMGGLHIAQIRNPWDQWRSFQVNQYFSHRLLSIALNLKQVLPAIFENFSRFQDFSRQVGHRPLAPKEGLALTGESDLRSIFLTIWVVSTVQALYAADFVMDMDLLSQKEKSKRQAQDWLTAHGLPVVLDDCALPTNQAETNEGVASELWQSVARNLKESGGDFLKPFGNLALQRLAQLSAASAKPLQDVLV